MNDPGGTEARSQVSQVRHQTRSWRAATVLDDVRYNNRATIKRKVQGSEFKVQASRVQASSLRVQGLEIRA